jgi:hypothetical protein
MAFEATLWASRASFVLITFLLMWLVFKVLFDENCDDSSKLVKKKRFWVTVVLAAAMGTYGIMGASLYSQTLKRSNNAVRAAQAQAVGAAQVARAAGTI